jgi:hypothetical protein
LYGIGDGARGGGRVKAIIRTASSVKNYTNCKNFYNFYPKSVEYCKFLLNTFELLLAFKFIKRANQFDVP